MRSSLLALALVVSSLLAPRAADAAVTARVSKSAQTMTVYVNGNLEYVWPVSTGRGRYATPAGSFRPQRLERRWYSSKYNNAPMHNAVFFHGGYAIHATTETGKLGRPASHGCIRLAPAHAQTFFALVRSYGAGATRISIGN